MAKKELIKFIEKFPSINVLTVGDLMLDKYVWGAVHRISQEAPVQIVDVEHVTFVPGGAANCAVNAASLGASSFILGVVGSDPNKDILLDELGKRGISAEFVVDPERPTIVKERIMARNQQILRVDYEKKNSYNSKVRNELIEKFRNLCAAADIIIISDYAKGINDPGIIPKIIEFCNQSNKIVIADFKSKTYLIYKNIFLITPNKHDSKEILHMEARTDEEVLEVCKQFSNDLNCSVLMTRGSQGMTIYDKSSADNGFITIPTKAQEVFDTTGAGDTVVAAVALALASGASLKQAAEIATHAAAVVIAKVGTAACSIDELKKDIESNS